jgi:hypothetical protein
LTTVEPITAKNPAPGQPAVVSGTVEVYDADFSQPSPFFRRRPTPERTLFGAPTSWPSPVLNLWVRVGRRVDAQLAPLPTLSDITRRGGAAAGASRSRTYLVHVPIARGKDFLAIRGTPQEPQIVLQARGRGGQLFPGDLAIQIDQYSYEAKIYPASAPELATGATLNQLRPPLAPGGGRGATQARIVDGQVTQFRIEEVQRRPGERIPLAITDYLYAHAPIRVGDQSVAFIVDGPVQSATALDVPWRTEPPINEDQVVRGLGADRLLAGGVIGETPLVAALAQAGLNVSSGLLFGTIEDALRRTGAVDDVSFQGIVEGEPKIQVGKTVLRNLYLSYTRTLAQSKTGTHDYELRGSYLFRRNLDATISTDEEQDVTFGLRFRKRF